jgi:hypothetical protein
VRPVVSLLRSTDGSSGLSGSFKTQDPFLNFQRPFFRETSLLHPHKGRYEGVAIGSRPDAAQSTQRNLQHNIYNYFLITLN